MRTKLVIPIHGKAEQVLLSDEEETQRDAEEKVWADKAPERELAALRMERNQLLAESDWRAMSDLTMSDDWKTYRQALRDLPANTADPTDVTWPTTPS